jgi:hypothetical protein
MIFKEHLHITYFIKRIDIKRRLLFINLKPRNYATIKNI